MALTEIAEKGAKESSCLERRGDVAGDARSGGLGDSKIALEASTSDGGADEC